MQTLSTADLIRKKYIGTDDLRKRLTEVLDKLPEQGGEVIVTQHGQPRAILVDLDAYLDLYETIEDLQRPGFIKSIHKEAAAVKTGRGITHEQLLKKLKIKL